MQATLPINKPKTNLSAHEPVELLQDSAFISKAAECVRHAKKSILICAYAWRWYENAPEKDIQKFNYEVARRAMTGLDIRAILDQKTQAEYLKQYNIKTKVFPTDKSMHIKAILIDERTLIIGSHNLTERGTAQNFEVSVLVEQPDVCLAFLDYFDRMWRNYAV